MARHKDINWNLTETATEPTASLAVLMDIRDELKRLNRVFECSRFLAIPTTLERIAKNTTRKPRKAKP